MYKIQILSLSRHAQTCSAFFENCGKTQEYFHDGKYKYTIGEFKTLESASAMLNIIQKIGYKDAFTIAFLNKERISEEEAITIENTTK